MMINVTNEKYIPSTVTTIHGMTIPYEKSVLHSVEALGVSPKYYFFRRVSPEEFVPSTELAFITMSKGKNIEMVPSTHPGIYFCANDRTYKFRELGRTFVNYSDPTEELEFNPFLNSLVHVLNRQGQSQNELFVIVKDAENSNLSIEEINGLYFTKLDLGNISPAIREKIGLYNFKATGHPERMLALSYKADSTNPYVAPIKKIFQRSSIYKAPKEHQRMLSNLFRGLTFGIENETSGETKKIPNHTLAKYGLIPLKDGSIQGLEYATVPMTAEQVFASIEAQLALFKEHQVQINHRCSLHAHIGGVPASKEFVVALYLLYYRIQNEIMGIMPNYLKDPMAIAGKNRNYAETISPFSLPYLIYNASIETDEAYTELIERLFKIIFNLYTGHQEDAKYNMENYMSGKVAPSWGNRSWNSATRYLQLNLVPFIMKENGTVEFRLHPPTLNYDKIIAWISICATIIKVAENSSAAIIKSFVNRQKITLLDVIGSLSKDFDLDGTQVGSPFICEFTNKLLSYVEAASLKRMIEQNAALSKTTATDQGHRGYSHEIMEQFKSELLDEARNPNQGLNLIPNEKEEQRQQQKEQLEKTSKKEFPAGFVPYPTNSGSVRDGLRYQTESPGGRIRWSMPD